MIYVLFFTRCIAIVYVSFLLDLSEEISPSRRRHFTISYNTATWIDAIKICHKHNQSLVKEINQGIVDAINLHSYGNWLNIIYIWTGLYDVNQYDTANSVYIWYDCTEYFGKFTNTDPGEHCLSRLVGSSILKTADCNEQLLFVCQQEKGECIFTISENRNFVIGTPGTTSKAIYNINSEDCNERCLNETDGMSECWAITYNGVNSTCILHLSVTFVPFIINVNTEDWNGWQFRLKKCFSFSSHFDSIIDTDVSFSPPYCWGDFKVWTQSADSQATDSTAWYVNTDTTEYQTVPNEILSAIVTPVVLEASNQVTPNITSKIISEQMVSTLIPLSYHQESLTGHPFIDNTLDLLVSTPIMSISIMYSNIAASVNSKSSFSTDSRDPSSNYLSASYSGLNEKPVISTMSTLLDPSYTTNTYAFEDTLFYETSSIHHTVYGDPLFDLSSSTQNHVGLKISSTSHMACSCTCDNHKNISQSVIEERVKAFVAELKVNSKNLSATQRRHISVFDDRPSSKSIGYIGIIILCSIFGGIVALDFSNLANDICRSCRILYYRFRTPSLEQKRANKSRRIFDKSFSLRAFKQRKVFITD